MANVAKVLDLLLQSKDEGDLGLQQSLNKYKVRDINITVEQNQIKPIINCGNQQDQLKFKEESEKKNKEIRYLKQEVEFLKDRLLTEDLRSSKKIRKLERNLHVKDRTIKNLNSEIYNTNISRIEERSISKESNTSRRHMIRDIVD